MSRFRYTGTDQRIYGAYRTVGDQGGTVTLVAYPGRVCPIESTVPDLYPVPPADGKWEPIADDMPAPAKPAARKKADVETTQE